MRGHILDSSVIECMGVVLLTRTLGKVSIYTNFIQNDQTPTNSKFHFLTQTVLFFLVIHQ